MNRWMVLALACSACGAETPPMASEPPVFEAGCERLLGRDGLVQGALVRTENPLDLAFDGPGWLVLEDGDGYLFTRRGELTIDAEGFLASTSGFRVLGYLEQQPGMHAIQVGSALMLPVPTRTITLRANLNADAWVQVFDPFNPTTTSVFSTTTFVYDSSSRAHTIDIYWTKVEFGTWEFHAMTDGSTLNGGSGSTEIPTGKANFDTDGRLVSLNQSSSFDPLGGTQPQPVWLDLGDPTGIGGTGLAGVTQFAGPSSTTFTGQDGLPFGTLVGFSTTAGGEILGQFNNGALRDLGTLAVALFSAPQALHRGPHDVMRATPETGFPWFVIASQRGSGVIISGALERSPKISNSCVP